MDCIGSVTNIDSYCEDIVGLVVCSLPVLVASDWVLVGLILIFGVVFVCSDDGWFKKFEDNIMLLVSFSFRIVLDGMRFVGRGVGLMFVDWVVMINTDAVIELSASFDNVFVCNIS